MPRLNEFDAQVENDSAGCNGQCDVITTEIIKSNI